MPKIKSIPKVTSNLRHRRKKSEMPFADALSAATKRLAHATKEREQAQKTLTALLTEIPHLQRTIEALRAQLHQQLAPMKADRVYSNEIVYAPQGIPVGVTLPAEDLTGMGSTRALDEDVLPDAEGQEIIPE